jgi:hypothetical protein
MWNCSRNTEILSLIISADLGEVQRISLVYFLYLFFFSGMEFTLTFLTHSVFKYSRSV